jgi:hypothetical protein
MSWYLLGTGKEHSRAGRLENLPPQSVRGEHCDGERFG